jgi:predicted enzyme involved in methoxymalonyl-ACP biosynthesis
VVGKGIEEAFFKSVIIRYNGVLTAQYIPTAKNGQVAEFYERMGLKLERMNDGGMKEYSAQIEILDTTIKDYYKIE